MGSGTASGIRRADARALLRPRAATHGEGRTLGAPGRAEGGECVSARVAEPFRALSAVGTGILSPIAARRLRSGAGRVKLRVGHGIVEANVDARPVSCPVVGLFGTRADPMHASIHHIDITVGDLDRST